MDDKIIISPDDIEVIDAEGYSYEVDKSLWGGWDRTLFNNGFGFSQPGEHRLTKEEFTYGTSARMKSRICRLSPWI